MNDERYALPTMRTAPAKKNPLFPRVLRALVFASEWLAAIAIISFTRRVNGITGPMGTIYNRPIDMIREHLGESYKKLSSKALEEIRSIIAAEKKAVRGERT
jgi:hypothetical protein